jgi:F0F1-type ATP synthase membrane subunit b/b'
MYKSPVPKLLSFFESSRDRWKSKCRTAKQANKLLANQTRAVEKSREQWKQAAQDAQRRIEELEREVEELKQPDGCRQQRRVAR